MGRRVVERLADGREVVEVAISAPGIVARVLTLGAVLHDLIVHTAAGARSVVLAHADLATYATNPPFFGAVVGRCANRIAGGRFTLDGQAHALTLNEAGRTHLHGGSGGIWSQLWQIEEHTETSVTLSYRSPAGEEGYPGTVDLTCRYSVEPDRLIIAIEGRTDAPTLLNIATHSYFRLDSSPDILDHELRIPAERYTPVDASLIPTGTLDPVAGTGFDFRTQRPIRLEDAAGSRIGYDHNFVVTDAPTAEPHLMAELHSPRSGLTLGVWSTEPGLQFYDGQMLPEGTPGRGGEPYAVHAGLCLEPQRFPDAIHHPAFSGGGAVLRPGEVYRQQTEYRFSR